jgi:putative ABC transport system permease protein
MTQPPTPRPPRLSTWLLRLALPAGEHGRSMRADLVEEFMARAVEQSPSQARAWYRRQSVSLAGRYLADPRRWLSLDTLRQDVRYAVRSLVAARGFTATVVATLAITIGAATAMFAIVNAVLIRPLPFPDSDRLMILSEQRATGTMSISWPDFRDWRARLSAFEGLAAYRITSFAILDPIAPDRVAGRQVTHEYFRVLGVRPAAGRDFAAEDDQPGATGVLIVSDRYAQKRFGGVAAALGETIRLGNLPRTIVGVLSPDIILAQDVFEPLGLSLGPGSSFLDRGNHNNIFAVGRLRDGATETAALEELRSLAAALSHEYPATNSGISADLEPYATVLTGDFRPVLTALFVAVAFLLLLGCANVTNLLISRAAARQPELALRTALGCSRRRLIRQLLAESVVLSLAGGAVGVALGWALLKGLLAIAPTTVPRMNEISLDSQAVLFALGVALVAAALIGLLPAIQASGVRTQSFLSRSGRGAISAPGSLRLGRGILIVEVSLALLLLCGAGLMIRTLGELSRVDLGFEPRGMLTARMTSSGQGWNEDRMAVFADDLLPRIRAVPGVESAALTLSLPIEGSQWGSVFVVGDKPVPPRAELPSAAFTPVSAGYFETMQMKLVSGRFLTDADRRGAPRVAVINETAARRLWPGESPLGKRVKQGWPEWETPWWEVVGVTSDIKLSGVIAAAPIQIYLPYPQNPSAAPALIVRGGDPEGLARPVEAALRQVAPSMPLYAVRTMTSMVGDNVARERASMALLAVFAGIALVLACVGLYGVMAHSVAQRTSEVGVRIALGASTSDIVRLFLGFGLITTVAGIAIGLAGAIGLTRFLQELLFGVKPLDALAFTGAAAILFVVALAACYLPARRAARIDATTAIRTAAS